ncbi:MAG: hypothetical protein JW909_09120 [Planctomycetes bacterium]|nr:hypothetical protein [Planctomycetota bacterium]
MTSSPPRTWKDFEGRWRRYSRMEKFLIVSLLLHFIIAAAWAFPKYHAYQVNKVVMKKKVEKEKKEKEEVREELEKAEEVLTEEARMELAESQLREFFDELTSEYLSDEERDERWDQTLDLLGEELDDLNSLLASDDFDQLLADEKVQNLREKMLESLHDLIAADLQTAWKERYLKYLEAASAKLAELFRTELDKRIGKPLNRDTQRFLDREVYEMRRSISATVSDLDNVRREADRVKSSMNQANSKIRPEIASLDRRTTELSALKEKRSALYSEQPSDTRITDLDNSIRNAENAARKSTDTIRRETSNAARDSSARLDRMKKPLDDSSARMLDIDPDISHAISDIRDRHHKNASDAASSESAHVDKSEYAGALESGSAAETSAAEISSGAASLKTRLQALKAEDIVKERVRSLLAEMDTKRLRKAFDEAFRKEYADNAYDELFKELNDQFQKEAVKRGIVPPPVSIDKELAEILGVKVPAMTDAGKVSTSELHSQQHLTDASGKARVGDVEVRTAREVTSISDGLIEREMRNVVGSALGNRHSWLLAADMELDEHGDANVNLLDRLGNLKNQMAQGRREFLGKSDSASLMSARRHRRSDQRTTSRIRNFSRGFDRDAYLAMIEKMKNRSGARGEAFDLKGESAAASVAEDLYGVHPAFVLSPPDSPPEPDSPDAPERKVQAPEFNFNKFTGIPYLNSPITIDGDLSDWKKLGIPMLQMDIAAKGPYGKKYAWQGFWLAYDSRGLYIAVDAKDTTGELENEKPLSLFWENDCIEIFIDAMNTKYGRRGEVHTHQFFVFPFGHKDDPSTGGYEALFDKSAGFTGKYPKYSQDLIPRAAAKTEQGWTIEFLISKDVIRRGELRPGRIIGFTLSCCTGSHIYYYWSFHHELRTSESPHTWGDIMLLGSDAALSLVDEENKEVKAAVFAGEALRIRVEDGDMNLDGRLKDRLRVNVSASSGDYEQVVLEETDLASGVFLGSILTRPSLGSPAPNVLDVFEGEDIKVEYIDQAQAFGERDVRITQTFKVTSAGSGFAAR